MVASSTATSRMSSAQATAATITSLLNQDDATIDDRTDVLRLDELRKIFAKLIQSGELNLDSTASSSNKNSAKLSDTTTEPRQRPTVVVSASKKWNAFLVESHKQFVQQLVHRIQHHKKRALIRTFWGVIASSPRISPKGYPLIASELLLQWVRALMSFTLDDKGLSNILLEFLQFRDVQFYLLGVIATQADTLYQTQQKRRSSKTKKQRNTNDDKKAKSTTQDLDQSHQQQQHRMLLELLCLIPVVTTQDDLEGALYLFPPADDIVPDGPDGEEDVSSSDEEEDDDDDDDSYSESDEEEYSVHENHHKRSRSSSSKVEASSSNKKKRKDEPKHKFSFQLARGHHRQLSRAWLAILRLDLPVPSLKQALLYLPVHVLPNVNNPLLFADFFMSAYSHSSRMVSILALDGLFVLMTQHRLEYPDFYKQLYRIVTPQVMFVKYRTRFFRLLDKCLKNELLPAHVVAAFVKRLCGCTMTAPPPAILFVLALCSNLIRNHPEIACLIHRNATAAEEAEEEDGFDADTNDPEQANALSSSLWEIQVLERHYALPVATLAKSLGTTAELKAPLHPLEDFLGHTYQSLMEQERKRRQHKRCSTTAISTTPITFMEPSGLLVSGDLFSSILETS